MAKAIAEMLDAVVADEWRIGEPFSDDITQCQAEFLRTDKDEDIASVLNGWIANYQPCLFGRIAARLNLISYCVLLESDLYKPDAFIQKKIQDARLEWLQSGLRGEKSAFIIAAISPKLAKAVPNVTVKGIATSLCSMYLLRNIHSDHIHLDQLELDIPGHPGSRWRWDVGVNYFSAHGDKRWWHDHRFPGGIAFSMNSVGHMIRSGKLAGAMRIFEEVMAVPKEGWRIPSLDSLEKALFYAMRTIATASPAVSGRATELLPLSDKISDARCPYDLPEDLQSVDYCEYKGYYHTDFTLPSEYFLPAVTRPNDVNPRVLDFTYLFDDRLDNPDYINMGIGRQVAARELESERSSPSVVERASKRNRAAGRITASLND